MKYPGEVWRPVTRLAVGIGGTFTDVRAGLVPVDQAEAVYGRAPRA